MTLLGQCPVCRNSIACSEAMLLAAHSDASTTASDSTFSCDHCGSALNAIDLSEVTEIAAHCVQCGSQFVVDRSGAGEALPCRCGATIAVPTAILIQAVQTSQPGSPMITQSGEISESVPKTIATALVVLPIVALPELHKIQIPPDQVNRDAISCDHQNDLEAGAVDASQLGTCEFETDAQIDEPRLAATSNDAKAVVRLPIVALPELHKIQIPPDQVNRDAISCDHQNDLEAGAVDASQLGTCEFETDAQIDEPQLPAASNDAQAVVRLPIVALPELYKIQIPPDQFNRDAISCDHQDDLEAVAVDACELDACELETCELETCQLEDEPQLAAASDEARAIVRLPIVAFPELFQIELGNRPVMECSTHTEPAEQVPDETDEPYRVDFVSEVNPTKTTDATTVVCPGCQRDYLVAKSEMGQTAECECGFIFVLQENIAALDSALCTDLMPYLPLAIDRTGTKPTPATKAAKQTNQAANTGADANGSVAGPTTARHAAARESGPRKSVPAKSWATGKRYLIDTAGILVTAAVFGYVLMGRLNGDPADSKITPARPKWVNPIPIGPNPIGPIARSPDALPAGEQIDQEAKIQLSAFLLPIRTLAKQLEDSESLGQIPLSHFSESVNQLDVTGARFTAKDLFWLAESWEGFGSRAENQALASKCYWQAACAFAFAQTLKPIEDSDLALAQRRQVEMENRSRQAMQLSVAKQVQETDEIGRR